MTSYSKYTVLGFMRQMLPLLCFRGNFCMALSFPLKLNANIFTRKKGRVSPTNKTPMVTVYVVQVIPASRGREER